MKESSIIEAGDRQQPVRERVQAREGHVRRSDHQRDHVVPQAGERGDDEQEDHQRRVHRDQAVEGLVVDELHPRAGELGAEDHRHQPGGDEEEDRRHEVLDPDHLVVGVRAEIVGPGAPAVRRVVLRLGRRPDRVADPVVERPDPGEEADRRRRQRRDDRDHVPLEQRLPARPPAEDEHEAEADAPEQGRHPGRADPPCAQPDASVPVRRCAHRGVLVERRRRHWTPLLESIRNATRAFN